MSGGRLLSPQPEDTPCHDDEGPIMQSDYSVTSFLHFNALQFNINLSPVSSVSTAPVHYPFRS
jgi:hypothetical protein